MKLEFQTPSLPPKLRVALHFLLSITLLNYLAQIPSYIHFYGVHHVAPSLFDVIFLLATLALFLAGYFLTLQMKKSGGWLLLVFLAFEFVGYLEHNLGGAFLNDLPTNDPLFFTVSLIGYLNFAASFIFLIVIEKNRHLFQPRPAMSEKGTAADGHSGMHD